MPAKTDRASACYFIAGSRRSGRESSHSKSWCFPRCWPTGRESASGAFPRWSWRTVIACLFDTGARPETVLQNARELKIDLSGVTEVILSHHHGDHTGGLVTLRRELARQNPKALEKAHVGAGIFLSRPGSGRARNQRDCGDQEANTRPWADRSWSSIGRPSCFREPG